MSRRALVTRLAVVAAIVAVFVVVQLVVGLPTLTEVRQFFDDLGWIAPVVFVLLYAASTVFLLPASVLTIGAGTIFGFGPGVALVLVGANLGALAGFVAARWLGRGSVEGVTRDRVRRLDERIGRHGFATVLVARLVPVIPFSTINYAFGLTSVTLRSYLLATVIGIVPGTTVYVAVGAFGFEPGSWPFVVTIVALVVLTAIGYLHSRRSRTT